MHISSLLLIAGALGATAHPSGHAHQAFHDKRAPGFFKATHKHTTPPPPPPAAPTPAPPPPPPPAPAPPPPAPAPAPAPASFGSSTYVPFCGGAGKRATAGEIAYAGNVGTGTYGCNIMPIGAAAASQYQYVAEFVNVDSQVYEMKCWNKIGPDGGINGFFDPNAAVTLTIAPGATQHVAFDTNTQGACGWAPGSLPTTGVGEYAGVWLEVDMGSDPNGGWSGADCSSLVAQSAGMSVPGCQVCFNGQCSSIAPGGVGNNAYVAGMADVDGAGLNIPPGNIKLEVQVGYS